jgi:hypothetical protein
MSSNFRKFPKTIKQEEFKDFQVLLYIFKDIQGLEFSFSNSRTFKDFQVLYEPCERFPNSFVPHAAARVYNNNNKTLTNCYNTLYLIK